MDEYRDKTKARKSRFLRIFGLGAIGVLLLTAGFGFFKVQLGEAQDTGLTDEETRSILDLNSAINEKREQLDELEEKTRVYEQTARKKEQESVSIQSQLESLDVQLEQLSLEIEKTSVEIEKYMLEIQQVEGSIKKRTGEIEDTKGKIAEFIRMIQRSNAKTYLEISLLNETFSRFFMREKAVHDVEGEIKNNLDRLVVLKNDLEAQQKDLTAKKTELDGAKVRLESNKSAQEDERQYKEVLQEQAEQEASRYQELLDEVQNEVNRATSEVGVLEDRFRQKLAEDNVNLEELLKEQGEFAWPVTPTRGLSTLFCDQDYPYLKYIPCHPGIDIPTPQGTAVRATADGIVSIARNTNWTTDRYGRRIPAYNYVSIIHGQNLSSVYGHLSQINVSPEQFVRKGEVIGLSGGVPGTAGAGLLTTGAHLHFEIRLNGLPVDPLGYLK